MSPTNTQVLDSADKRELLQHIADFPLEAFAYEQAPDNKMLWGADEWRLTVGDIRSARAAVAAGKFQLGDQVRKTKGSQWKGRVVGWYSTTLTPEGYAVESSTEHGSVQIYPAAALELDGGSNG